MKWFGLSKAYVTSRKKLILITSLQSSWAEKGLTHLLYSDLSTTARKPLQLSSRRGIHKD